MGIWETLYAEATVRMNAINKITKALDRYCEQEQDNELKDRAIYAADSTIAKMYGKEKHFDLEGTNYLASGDD